MSNPASARERGVMRATIGERGRQEAIAMRLSTKCAGRGVLTQHADMPGGCKNDGSRCLCECHDQPEGTSDAR